MHKVGGIWLGSALLLRLVLMSFPNAFAIDMNSFKGWSMTLLEKGLPNFYSANWCDYPPGYMYVLWLTGVIYHFFDRHLQFTDKNLLTFLIKFTPAIADLGASYLILAILTRLTSIETARRGVILYAFNPVLIFLSAVWGQVDSVAVCLMLLTIWLLQENRFILSGVMGALTVIVKPQGLFLAPTFLLSQWRIRHWWQWFIAVFLGWVSIWLAILPFYWQKISNYSAIVAWIIDPWLALYQQFMSGAKVYPYATVNAFNIWISLNWQSDSISKIIGLSLLTSLFVWVGIFLYRQPQGLFLATALVLFGVFMLATRMHERYIVYSLPFLLIASCLIPSLRSIYYGLSGTSLVNIVYVYTKYSHQNLWDSMPLSWTNGIAIFTAITNLGLLLALIRASVDHLLANPMEECIRPQQSTTDK